MLPEIRISGSLLLRNASKLPRLFGETTFPMQGILTWLPSFLVIVNVNPSVSSKR